MDYWEWALGDTRISITSRVWVGPPPTNGDILGIYKDLKIITITSCGHYYWVGAQPKVE